MNPPRFFILTEVQRGDSVSIALRLVNDAAQGDKPRKDASGIEVCALFTVDEIEGAAGWKPEAIDPETHQRTATCTYHRADGAKVQTVVLIVSPGMKVLESS